MAAKFVIEVEATHAGAFLACGKYFAYITPDNADALMAEASAWYIERERTCVCDHDDYGEYDRDTTYTELAWDTVGSLSEPRSMYADAADILVRDGRVEGFILYTGKDTDRYGCFSPIPIYAKSDYDLPPHFFRPDPGEVEIAFSIFYISGTTLGKCKKSFSSWGDRSNSYYRDFYILKRRK